MTDLVFVDTNVVICTRDRDTPEKARQATDWIRLLRNSGALVISPQVINEAYSVALWKFERTPRDAIRGWLRNFMPYCTAPLDVDVVAAAFAVEAEVALAWWDCLIVASALVAGCTYVLSEDMQHDRIVRTTRIVNPFRTTPVDLLAGR